MYTYPIQAASELEHLRLSITPPQEIWQREVRKFVCPDHLSRAELISFKPADDIADAEHAIRACCQEFADFCRHALCRIIAAESFPAAEIGEMHSIHTR